LPEAVNSQTLGLLRQQLGEAQRKAVNLGTSLGPMHPEYLAAQSTLRDAQRAVADEITRIRSAARAEFDRAVGNEKTLQAHVESLKKDTLSTSRDTVQLRELERELEANRAVYQSFLQRARETGEQERVDTTNARIIATAVPPIDKSGPPKRLIVAGAAAGGFALGLLLALLAELAAVMERRREDRESLATASETVAVSQPEQASARQTSQRPDRATMAAPAPGPSANDDLLRMLRMLGQLEKAIQQNGMPR
jgi:polysaccharide biosynthesis transport protein